ncbi:MAG: PEP-CTERM sorting domain-containing protein [Phycisphaeraceae bacterium]|nr:PEP-CTERM sorting domain-containing protein [Phycisphaeraceae bacterium]
MKNVLFVAAAIAAVSGAAQAATTYNDAQNDLFDNGFANLDIKSVTVSHDANNVYFSVETRGFANWTKYMIFMNVSTGSDFTPTNAWNRPVNLTTNISHYVGSWVDQPNTNQQNWAWDGFNWNMDGGTTDNDQTQIGSNIVKFTVSRSFLGLLGNGVILFDIATSGGGGTDPGVDHLSRNTPATTGWGEPSTSGTFLAYTVPTPGSLALIGLGGLVAARRRR